MVYKEVVFENLLKENAFISSIAGIFVKVDWENRKIYLLGNNKDIINVDKKSYQIDFEEVKNYIDESIYEYFRQCFVSKQNQSISYEFSLSDNNKRLTIQGQFTYDNDACIAFEGYICDISNEQVGNFKKIELNMLDEITRLHNKGYLKEKIEAYLMDNNNKSAIMMLDLDNFKYINDSFGTKCGDMFLREVAKELENLISDKDNICRFGGDEFLVFLPRIESVRQVEDIAKNIVGSLSKHFLIDSNQVTSTLSLGISIYPNDGQTFEKLIKNADAAMYIAKNNGKNQYQFFNSEISEEMDKIYSIQKGLITALDKNEIYVVFQSKVTLDNDKVCGFEALIRWQNEELGFVSPLEFIPIAETTGKIIPIGNFVLREIFVKIRYLLDNGYDNFRIAYNLSEVQLREGTIITVFENLIKEFKVSGRYLEIEITESMLMKSFNKNNEYLLRLKELGATIALDDFGTGYSSLNYLTKLPIDVLKIDRSFVSEIVDNTKNRWIIENIIELSHKLGISVVAEGVEIVEQVNYLKEVLCDIVQGYYYSKPEKFDKAIAMLSK